MEQNEYNPIDTNFANNLGNIEQYQPGSDERRGLLEENKFYHQCRKDEADYDLEERKLEIEVTKNEIEARKLDLEKEKNEIEKEKLKEDRINRIIDAGVKVGLTLVTLGVGFLGLKEEIFLEEHGTNRSKGRSVMKGLIDSVKHI